MANPFYTGNNNPNIIKTTSNNNNLKDIYNILMKSKNPYDVFNNIVKNNPNMQPIVNLLEQGYSPQQVFTSLCKQRGINPQEFLSNLSK